MRWGGALSIAEGIARGPNGNWNTLQKSVFRLSLVVVLSTFALSAFVYSVAVAMLPATFCLYLSLKLSHWTQLPSRFANRAHVPSDGCHDRFCMVVKMNSVAGDATVVSMLRCSQRRLSMLPAMRPSESCQ